MKTMTARPSLLQTLVGYYGFILIGLNSVLIASLIRNIQHDFRQTDATFGLLYFISSLFYASGAFVGGVMTERVGRRVVLTICTFLLAVGLLGEATAPVWPILLLATVPVNLGAGALDGGINGLFLDLFRHARGGALNFLHLFFSVGASISPFFIGRAVAAGISWRALPLAVCLGAIPLVALLLTQPLPSGRHDPTAAKEKAPGDLTATELSLRPFIGLACSIGFYVAAELSISSWVVKFFSSVPVSTATSVLSLFWAGIAVGRFVSNWLAERFSYIGFTIACLLLSSITLALAVLSPTFALSATLFFLCGVFNGPVYPMIMAIGGVIYPNRLATLSGSLATAAVAGSVIYPPLIGVMAAHIGIGGGLLGGASLGIFATAGILVARPAARLAAAAATRQIVVQGRKAGG